MSVQSVERALKILALFSHRQPVLGISELSRMMDLPKGTVHGLTRTLVEHGFLREISQNSRLFNFRDEWLFEYVSCIMN